MRTVWACVFKTIEKLYNRFLSGMASLPMRQAVKDLNLVVAIVHFRDQYLDGNMTVESVPKSAFIILRAFK